MEGPFSTGTSGAVWEEGQELPAAGREAGQRGGSRSSSGGLGRMMACPEREGGQGGWGAGVQHPHSARQWARLCLQGSGKAKIPLSTRPQAHLEMADLPAPAPLAELCSSKGLWPLDGTLGSALLLLLFFFSHFPPPFLPFLCLRQPSRASLAA